MPLPRLPIPAAPARHETLASYLARLARLHGIHPRELREPISTPRPGTKSRDVIADRLAAITGRPGAHLAAALPELRDPAPDWTAWRHQSQPRCPRCDARHDGGPVLRLLPHHRYVCMRHRYWIGPPDAGQPATPLDHVELRAVVRAQRRHLRLLRRHGSAVTYDAVLTGMLLCGHVWDDRNDEWHAISQRWTHRGHQLIPAGLESSEFSAARLFAAVYPEAVDLAELLALPTWRSLACGDSEQQKRFGAEIGRRLARPDYRLRDGDDAIAHWMRHDSWRPPSRPQTTFPQTREHGSNRPAKASSQSLDRQRRSATWFATYRRGGGVLLHHRHLRPVLVRDWSTPMDGITATIWASRTTHDLNRFAPSAPDYNDGNAVSASG